MKTDIYTKTVLTVIAVCLVVICLNLVDAFPKVYAQAGSGAPVKVEIVGISSSIYTSLPVKIDRIVEVDIQKVGMFSTHGLPVRVENSRAIPVKVENSYISTKPY